jgi:hypothetical protein
VAGAVFHSGFEAQPELRAVLREADEGIRVTSADTVEEREVAEWVAFVLAGGGLLLCGGEGPLLRALNLQLLQGPVAGAATPLLTGLDPVEVAGICPVSGPGFALYRVDEDCIALGGLRGEGRVAFLGTTQPSPALAQGCLKWISRQN